MKNYCTYSCTMVVVYFHRRRYRQDIVPGKTVYCWTRSKFSCSGREGVVNQSKLYSYMLYTKYKCMHLAVPREVNVYDDSICEPNNVIKERTTRRSVGILYTTR